MAAAFSATKFRHLRISAIALQQFRHGYIVLLPEVSQHALNQNLLVKDDLPDFGKVTMEKCFNMVGKNLLDLEHNIRQMDEELKTEEKVPTKSLVVSDTLAKLDRLSAPLEVSWGLVKTLHLANSRLISSASFTSVQERVRRVRASKFISPNIYKTCKSCDQSKLPEEEQRVISKYLLEGRLNGLELSPYNQEVLFQVMKELRVEKEKFRERINHAIEKFKHVIKDPTIVRDFPEDLLEATAADSEKPMLGPWFVPLDPEVRTRFIEHCPSRDHRWDIWQAATRIASTTEINPLLNNSSCLEHIRKLRSRQAKILGYESFAHMSMETKMAGSVENIQKSLGDLMEKAKPAQERELQALQDFAEKRGFDAPLQPWDVPFWARKEKISLYNWNEEKLREYFPLPKVFAGLMSLTERLFAVRIQRVEASTWHPDVSAYHIWDSNVSNSPIGLFYFDPCVRPGKVNGQSWSVGIRPASMAHKPAPPICSLMLNLPAPDSRPVLLTFSQVELLFQKFGQTLQHLLSTATYADVAGVSNIEWDAVGIVSNFMTHWLTDPNVLASISGHYENGEALPVRDISFLREHMAGFNLSQEIYYSALDLQLHSTKEFWQSVVRRLWPQHMNFVLDKWYAHPCSWVDCLAGDWGAAVYTDLWSRMIAADVYAAFTEAGADQASIGHRFRDTFLSLSGSSHPSEVFRRFRGRDPSMDAFLQSLGLH